MSAPLPSRVFARVVERALGRPVRERAAIDAALQTIPLAPWHTGAASLWTAYEQETADLLTAADAGGRLLGAAFVSVGPLPRGGACLEVLGTVSLAPEFDLTAHLLPQLERLGAARACACLSLATVRPGLVDKLTRHHGYTVAAVELFKPLDDLEDMMNRGYRIKAVVTDISILPRKNGSGASTN